MHKDCEKILFTEEQIVQRCKELGAQISKDYEGKDLLVIGLLKGSVPFLAELTKHITLDITFDYMQVSSYNGTESTGNIVMKRDVDNDLSGKDILIVEDILDTGRTLGTVKPLLLERGAKSVEIVALLDKVERRVVDIHAKYAGFVVPDAFVIGFGLDYNQKYRNLPYIGILKKEVYS